eukprot:CAMPEP_0181118020 /NCGR_PEP_ID=MMETSP1071-20121207/22849_1 /TAXON_ID=35127 /ORGANISM="Thalassiosira sp., Strain NH16" /LENGTH=124 /DNA_ID=CAMNT_0023202479 /DNA_START=109 /DNA_END=479 /DNA_ORIENTATION=-
MYPWAAIDLECVGEGMCGVRDYDRDANNACEIDVNTTTATTTSPDGRHNKGKKREMAIGATTAAAPLDRTKYFLNGKMKKSAMNASAEAESARDDRYFKNGKMKKGARDRWVKNYMLRDETLIP